LVGKPLYLGESSWTGGKKSAKSSVKARSTDKKYYRKGVFRPRFGEFGAIKGRP